MDTANRFLVAVHGDEIVTLMPVPRRLSKADALNLAAWLVALADDGDEFLALLQEVENS